MDELKCCSKCSETKPTINFGAGKNTKDGFYYWCKPCVKKHNEKRKYRKKLSVDEMSCGTCQKIKPVQEFGKSSAETTGYKKQCKSCRKTHDHDNKEQTNHKRRVYRRDNLDLVRSREKSYQENNKEKILANRVKYRKNNKGKRASYQAKRRANKISATPMWADTQYIQDLYVNCREAESVFERAGIQVKFNVDHIIPLQGKTVSGLHVEDNLQILTDHDNFKKHSTWIGFTS